MIATKIPRALELLVDVSLEGNPSGCHACSSLVIQSSWSSWQKHHPMLALKFGGEK
jgi:hypothetical protein